MLAAAHLGGRLQSEAEGTAFLNFRDSFREATDDRNGVGQRPPDEVQTLAPFARKEIIMESLHSSLGNRIPWNKGKLTGQKPPLKLSEIWAIRTRLQMSSNVRELAMFNLAIDSKLRACDFTRLHVQDVCHGNQVATRATVLQHKTQRPVSSRSRAQLVNV